MSSIRQLDREVYFIPETDHYTLVVAHILAKGLHYLSLFQACPKVLEYMVNGSIGNTSTMFNVPCCKICTIALERLFQN